MITTDRIIAAAALAVYIAMCALIYKIGYNRAMLDAQQSYAAEMDELQRDAYNRGARAAQQAYTAALRR